MATAQAATPADDSASGSAGGLGTSDSDNEGDCDSLPSSTSAHHFHDDHKHVAWNIKSSIAFWISAWTVEGAVLFTVGSVFLYPGMLPKEEDKEYVERAWVDYPFMLGAWCFTIGNYLCYFQAINRGHAHEKRFPGGRRFFWPTKWNGGCAAAGLNCCGAVLFNINTVEMFIPGIRSRYGLRSWNVWYVAVGAAGSAFFVVAGFIQGEYNEWRQLKCTAPVVISHMNFWGGVMFLLAYMIDWNHFASRHEAVTIWGVATPFTVGSAFFVCAAFAELWMWKTENFGLGFAISLKAPRRRAVQRQIDATSMFFIGAYFLNIAMSWVRFGFIFSKADYRNSLGYGVVHKVAVYHLLLFLISVYHKIPNEHPYDLLVYGVRALALFGLIGEAVQISHLVLGYV